MELELGLALPTPLIPIKLLDPNRHGTYEPKETFALSWPLLKLTPTSDIETTSYNSSSSSSSRVSGSKKRCFDDNRIVPKTLHLLHLSTNQPNDEDEPSKDLLRDNSSSAILKNYGEGLVGWPPLKTGGKKRLGHQIPHDGADNNRMAAVATVDNGIGGSRDSKSTYVKVKMEGVAIARKIDLSVHHSFEALTSTLMRMFGISDENRNSFKLAYQDREGDWLLAQDVTWRSFIRTLRCLKLIRSRD